MGPTDRQQQQQRPQPQPQQQPNEQTGCMLPPPHGGSGWHLMTKALGQLSRCRRRAFTGRDGVSCRRTCLPNLPSALPLSLHSPQLDKDRKALLERKKAARAAGKGKFTEQDVAMTNVD